MTKSFVNARSSRFFNEKKEVRKEKIDLLELYFAVRLRCSIDAVEKMQ